MFFYRLICYVQTKKQLFDMAVMQTTIAVISKDLELHTV